MKVSLDSHSICDDAIARNIKPHPLSVSEALDHISKNYDCEEITELDLSENNIYEDVNLVINFVIDNLTNIEELNLSHNNYIECSEETIKLLKRLLDETKINRVILKGTNISDHYRKYITNLFIDFGDRYDRIKLGIEF